LGQAGTNSNLLYLALIFIISGLGYKVAVVPFHSWSPDVYQGAPTPVTAFLSTASKTAGFVLLYRVLVNGFGPLAGSAAVASGFGGWTSILAFIAFLTMTYGNLAAITQTNAKRLLAYSSIAHAGFLLLGLIGVYAPGSPGGQFSQFGVQSLVYYLIAYTFTNLGAFGALAAISRVVGGDDLSDLNGLYKRNLGLAVLMAVFVLSLAGIPPLSGFWAKFMVFQAGWESGAIWLVVVAVLNTIISLYYYLRLLKAMFMHEPLTEERINVPAGINFSLVVSALIVFFMGLLPNFFLPAINSVTQIASGG
ncbi:MAG: NADH-quinone oxidoreductase subunit N, partial [Chloroflexi bacterium]|nr:NADH-quinone oxidoreductase subunit N [Chloroflexota bacterium]